VCTTLTVGDNLDVGDDAVLHRPLESGDDLTIGDDSVVFRVSVGNGGTVGEDVVIRGPASEEDPDVLTLEIPDGVVIPDDVVITDEETLRQAMSDTPQTIPDTGGMTLQEVEGLHER
jgi:carbon dioxide concentrating mechanism protein CcmM